MTDDASIPAPYTAALILADGTVFYGYGFGIKGIRCGEVCFNTAMSGYQEILTDPSYAGQIITFTAPHIGNVGCNKDDMESKGAYCAGLITREIPTQPSNFRSEHELSDWCESQDITGIAGVDTRALTRHIRLNGAANVAICYGEDVAAAKAKLAEHPSMQGLDLAKEVTTESSYTWDEPTWCLTGKRRTPEKGLKRVAVVDYGEKYNILRLLVDAGCELTVYPAATKAADILEAKPDGIFLSNGPGDPSATATYAVPEIKAMIDSGTPIFGICLGHQLLTLALGGGTEKMFQGHRGANHPVQNLADKAIAITSQNHGFSASHNSLPKGAEVTHLSLFDGTIQGIRAKDKPVFGVQFHPEGSPGPHDTHGLFTQFVEMMHAA